MKWNVSVLLLVCGVAGACSATSGSGRSDAGPGAPGGSGSGAASSGGAPVIVGGSSGGGAGVELAGEITTDLGETVTATGETFSGQFTLSDPSGQPITAGVAWTTDDTRIGSISDQGVFTGNGFVGGKVIITAQTGTGHKTVEFTVNVEIVDNLGALDQAAQDGLTTGGSADGTFRWLYPYAGTVFPRGIDAPLLQLGGTAADAAYLEISAPHFHYRQFAGGSDPTQLSLPAEVWNGLGLTAQPGEPVTVEVTKATGGAVTGPVASNWLFASASLKGIVYYSTYNYLPPGETEHDGAIMRVRPRSEAEPVQIGCTVCHTVSANGKVLATGIEYGSETPGVLDNSDPDTLNPYQSATYDLDENGGITERHVSEEGRTFAFLGLSPDGSVGLRSGIPAAKWPPHIPRGVYSEAGFPTELVDTATGAIIESPSLNELVTYAHTPAFSPDGTKVAFLNGDILTANSNDRVLSVLDVDLNQSPPEFSNLRNVVQLEQTAVAWPTFLPDGNGIIYHEGDSLDSSLFNPDANARAGAQYAELRLVDVAGGRVNSLRALNGRDGSGEFYLPYGAAEEGRMNYEASVLPIAVGGYYWVLFTSRRAYGNQIAPGGVIEGAQDPWGTESKPSPRKKIWLAAIDIDYAASSDPSHPALYLPGQGIEAGNMRAYAALAPCKPNGSGCETGADCCEGFCRETSRSAEGVPVLECVPPPEGCSNVDELCESAADCCDDRLLCINERCTSPSVPTLK